MRSMLSAETAIVGGAATDLAMGVTPLMHVDRTPKSGPLLAAWLEFGAGIHAANGIRHGLPAPPVARQEEQQTTRSFAIGKRTFHTTSSPENASGCEVTSRKAAKPAWQCQRAFDGRTIGPSRTTTTLGRAAHLAAWADVRMA